MKNAFIIRYIKNFREYTIFETQIFERSLWEQSLWGRAGEADISVFDDDEKY